jgi:hypothetical protein
MIALRKPESTIIKPYNISIDTQQSKKFFLANFKNDELSYTFVRVLLCYCKNYLHDSSWMILTPLVLKNFEIIHEGPLPIEETVLFKEGYFIKAGLTTYLTHEFVVELYMACLNTAKMATIAFTDINFLGTPKLLQYLRNKTNIKESVVIKFLIKLATVFHCNKGDINSAILTYVQAAIVANKVEVVPIIAFDIASNYHMIALDEDKQKILCKGLLCVFYCVSPKET